MSNLNFVEMQKRNSLLWMLIEAGEVADIIKKDGNAAVVENMEVRRHFIEGTLAYWGY